MVEWFGWRFGALVGGWLVVEWFGWRFGALVGGWLVVEWFGWWFGGLVGGLAVWRFGGLVVRDQQLPSCFGGLDLLRGGFRLYHQISQATN